MEKDNKPSTINDINSLDFEIVDLTQLKGGEQTEEAWSGCFICNGKCTPDPHGGCGITNGKCTIKGLNPIEK